MQQKIRLANGYTFNRVINGCWQLSAEHNLQGKTDVDDALQGFHELVEHLSTVLISIQALKKLLVVL